MHHATALRLDEPCVADPSASLWLDDATFSERVSWEEGVVAVIAGTVGLRSTRDAAAAVGRACAKFPCVSAYLIDAEAQPSLSRFLRVEVLPTVVLYRAGAEIGRLEGMRSDFVYELAIETAVNAPVGV
jgi:hypothetical protein